MLYRVHRMHGRGRKTFPCKSQECLWEDWYISILFLSPDPSPLPPANKDPKWNSPNKVWEFLITYIDLPENKPNELTMRKGEAAETINATAVVREVKNIARAERLKRTKVCLGIKVMKCILCLGKIHKD